MSPSPAVPLLLCACWLLTHTSSTVSAIGSWRMPRHDAGNSGRVDAGVALPGLGAVTSRRNAAAVWLPRAHFGGPVVLWVHRTPFAVMSCLRIRQSRPRCLARRSSSPSWVRSSCRTCTKWLGTPRGEAAVVVPSLRVDCRCVAVRLMGVTSTRAWCGVWGVPRLSRKHCVSGVLASVTVTACLHRRISCAKTAPCVASR